MINVSSLEEVSESQMVYSSGIHIWDINWQESQRGFISTIGFMDSSTNTLLVHIYSDLGFESLCLRLGFN